MLSHVKKSFDQRIFLGSDDCLDRLVLYLLHDSLSVFGFDEEELDFLANELAQVEEVHIKLIRLHQKDFVMFLLVLILSRELLIVYFVSGFLGEFVKDLVKSLSNRLLFDQSLSKELSIGQILHQKGSPGSVLHIGIDCLIEMGDFH